MYLAKSLNDWDFHPSIYFSTFFGVIRHQWYRVSFPFNRNSIFIDSFFNEGDTKVIDTTTTNQTATWAEKIATIAAADIPAAAQTITLGFTPIAHGTDTMELSAAWLEYTKIILTS